MLYTETVKNILDPTASIKPIVLAGCFGLAGTLIPVFISLSKERDAVSQRCKQLDEATRRVQFWDQWLKLSTVIGDPADDIARQRVRHELEMLCEILGGASAQIHAEQAVLQHNKNAFQTKVNNVSFIRRLLLLYKPARNIAWIPRVFFYFFVVVAVSGYILDRSGTDRAILPIFLLFVASAFRGLSHWVERPRKQTAEVSPVLAPPRPQAGGTT